MWADERNGRLLDWRVPPLWSFAFLREKKISKKVGSSESVREMRVIIFFYGATAFFFFFSELMEKDVRVRGRWKRDPPYCCLVFENAWRRERDDEYGDW